MGNQAMAARSKYKWVCLDHITFRHTLSKWASHTRSLYMMCFISLLDKLLMKSEWRWQDDMIVVCNQGALCDSVAWITCVSTLSSATFEGFTKDENLYVRNQMWELRTEKSKCLILSHHWGLRNSSATFERFTKKSDVGIEDREV